MQALLSETHMGNQIWDYVVTATSRSTFDYFQCQTTFLVSQESIEIQKQGTKVNAVT